MVNPVVSDAEGEVVEEEGCLSIPGPYHVTPRAAHVVCRGVDVRGRPLEMSADGLLARIFQHESDHLDGRLYIDRLDDEGRTRRAGGAPADRARPRGAAPRRAMTLRVAFLGNDPWSVPALEAVDADPELVLDLVVTNPPRPAGRGDRLRATPVADAARRLGLPLLEADGVAEGGPAAIALEGVARPRSSWSPTATSCPRPLLRLPTHGAMNLHFSLLPRWRGAAPVQHALLAGDAITGVTVMRMDEGLDTGPILAQLEDADPPRGRRRRARRAARRPGRPAPRRRDPAAPGRPVPARPQDEARATWAPALVAADRDLAWTEPAAALERRVRALAPRPGAVATFRGTRCRSSTRRRPTRRREGRPAPSPRPTHAASSSRPARGPCGCARSPPPVAGPCPRATGPAALGSRPTSGWDDGLRPGARARCDRPRDRRGRVLEPSAAGRARTVGARPP